MSFFQIHSFCMILRATSSLLAVSVASRTLGQEKRGQEGNNKERGMTTGARTRGRNDQSTDLDRLKKEETAGPATKISGEPLITPSFARRTEEPKNSAYSSGQFIGQRRRLVFAAGSPNRPGRGVVPAWSVQSGYTYPCRNAVLSQPGRKRQPCTHGCGRRPLRRSPYSRHRFSIRFHPPML